MLTALRQVGWLALLPVALFAVSRKAPAQRLSAVDEVVGQGAALLDKGELGGAQDAFRRALSLDPNLAAAHNLLGTTYERMGLSFEAIKEFDAAQRLEPSPEFAYNLALAYYRAGFYTRAIATLQESPSAGTRTSEFYRLMGDAEVSADQYLEGVRDLRKSAALDPSNPGTLYDLGIAILKSGADRDALALLSEAAADFPQSSNIRMALGIAQYMNGAYESAELSFRSAAQLDKSPVSMYLALGDFYLGTGKTEAARNAYLKAIAADAADPVAHTRYGETLARAGRWDEAIASFQKSIALKPDYSEARSELGKALYRANRLEEAQQALELAILMNRYDREAYYQLARVYVKLGSARKARQTLEVWNQLDPGRVEAARQSGKGTP
jgi:tetratricopeptide (TPR) repeat protein